MEDNSRMVVINTLNDIYDKKAYSNIKLSYYFKKYDLNSMDRAFATEILYGTIRYKLKIDYMIQKFSKIKINKMSTSVLSCIETAVYQVFYMDKVPEFAAVNQAVNIVKIKDKRAAGFVNGVLRNILRNKGEFENIDIKDKIKRLSIEFSHPEWIIKKFIDIYGEEFVVDFMKKNNCPPKLVLRVNTLKCSKEDLKSRLESYEVNDGFIEDALIVKGLNSIEKSPEYKEGWFFVQDQSSMLAVKVLSPEPGDKILDLCSAPGGKATYIAQMMNNTGEVLAFDIYEHKIKLINENAKRLGIDIIKTILNDSAILMDKYIDYADKVLVDAPCSGLGLMRKKPEIRWNIAKEDIDMLVKLQYSILYNASKYVKKDGVIVYSTCTVTKEENEDIIAKFLDENGNFELEDISEYVPETLKCDTLKDGYIKLFPNLYDTDGFFVSRLRRKK